MATGGPQQYTGRSMRESHKGMNITEQEWNAFCSDFRASLEKFKVGDREMGELTTIIVSLKAEIMGTSLYDRLGGSYY
jgi:hemoglobin